LNVKNQSIDIKPFFHIPPVKNLDISKIASYTSDN